MFISIFCGDADGDGLVCGIFIPGMFICCGEGLAVGDVLVAGIFIPGIFIPGILPIRCFFAGRLFLAATFFFFGPAFRLAVDLDFGIFMPGMFCMLC